MKHKLFLIAITFFLSFGIFTSVAQAACPAGYTCGGGCEAIDQCVNNKRCTQEEKNIISPNGAACGSSQLHNIEPPAFINKLNIQAGGGSKGNGLLIFFSALLRLFAIICGIWTMFNFLMSGYTLISSQHEVKAQTEVKDKLTMTVIGLVIIVGAYTMAGLFGLIFFGDASAIINPQLRGALQ